MAQIGTNTWNAITYGNGLYVVGGGINDEGGWIAYSTNGSVWQTTKITGIRGVHDVIFDGVRFIATGDSGFKISISTDGKTWPSATTINDNNLVNRITYANGLYVAACWNGYVAWSEDAVNWTFHRIQSTTSYYKSNFVAYLHGKFFIAGDDNKITTSTDGKTWTNFVTIGGNSSGNIYSIASDGQKLVTVNNSAYCSVSVDNGNSWTNWKWCGTDGQTFMSNIRIVRYYNGKFIIIGSRSDGGNTGEDVIMYSTSTDGLTWSEPDFVLDESEQQLEFQYVSMTAMLPVLS
jgi:hypothetical protein